LKHVNLKGELLQRNRLSLSDQFPAALLQLEQQLEQKVVFKVGLEFVVVKQTLNLL
jgi:hypothetical protein